MSPLPIPSFFQPEKVGELWRVPYEDRVQEATAWAKEYQISEACNDAKKVSLFLVDVQNTFCLPDFELYVGGRDGQGAVNDNRRLAKFIYQNLNRISKICLTMDTHRAMQIFHAAFLVDAEGNHPPAYTTISVDDLESNRWRFNPALAPRFEITPEIGQERLLHYAKRLASKGKYAWTIWPYHAMLGGVGHAITPAIEEAVLFHSIARKTQADFKIKGEEPFTEHYSALGPEVLTGPRGEKLGERDTSLVDNLKDVDALIIAGQAKSHCVAWTVADLLAEIEKRDPSLAQKIYLLEDCTSPVVTPAMDFTDQADAAFERFAQAGMHIVRSTDDIQTWGEIFR